MARVTVEDCLDNVDNRFDLVLVASKRSRQIAMGKEPLVEWENDKPTVVALREIADGLIDSSILNEVPEVVEEEPLEDELAAEVAEELHPGTQEPENIDEAAAIKAALGGDVADAEETTDSDENAMGDEEGNA